VHVPEKVILHPERLTAEEILSERNLEVQRAMIERIGGLNQLLSLAKAGVYELHRTHHGTLYRLERTDPHRREEPWVFVQVTCPSTGRQYCLSVPPRTKTVQQGIAWTFGMLPEEYSPDHET